MLTRAKPNQVQKLTDAAVERKFNAVPHKRVVMPKGYTNRYDINTYTTCVTIKSLAWF
jgi:hypothetical protein